MRSRITFSLATAAALAAMAGCSDGDGTSNQQAAGDTEAAGEAGNSTIASGLNQEGRFFTLAKAAGLDLTLAGPGPYTVIVPSDAAFEKLPAGTLDTWTSPEGRPELTRTLIFHILPGTVLAEDIAKAIDNGDGKAQLATMGGEALTATKDGDRIILSDSAGGKATVTNADINRSNGVVHETDSVLMPGAAS